MRALPQELLDHILRHLSVSDVASVLKACLMRNGDRSSHSYHSGDSQDVCAIKRAVDERIDPKSHFRGWFSSRTGTVLVGPRAFDYFANEGILHHDGTWDFLIQWFPADVLDMLLSLSEAGVSWETPLQRASRQLQSCIICQEEIRNVALARARDGGTLEIMSTLKLLSMCSLHERQGVLTSVRGLARDGKTQVLLHVQAPRNEEVGSNVLTAPFRHLCDVRFSHLQCMVAGYTAIHMNMAATEDKEVIILYQGMGNTPSQSLLPEGYHVGERHEAHGALRSLADTGSLCMNLSRFSEIDRGVASSAHHIVTKAAWYEFEKETVAIPSMVDYAVKIGNSPFIDHYWGKHKGQDVAKLVGRANHSFSQHNSLSILMLDYGVANEWARDEL